MTGHDASELQAAEYSFPYHHLPAAGSGRVRTGRVFRGGAEYLAYLEEVAERVEAARPGSVLDVGCGDGRLLLEIEHRLPGSRLVGVDLDERAVTFASAFGPGIDFRVADVGTLEELFDVVTCVETLEHLPDDLEVGFLRAATARVRPGGRFVITVPSTSREVTAKHHRHYTVSTLRAAVAAADPDLVEVDVREIVRDRPWLDRALPFLSNRQYSIDVGVLNAAIARMHRRPVGAGHRGQHVLGVYTRRSDD